MSELSLRIEGLVFQILGIFVAYSSVHDTLKRFGKPTFLEKVWSSFSQPNIPPMKEFSATAELKIKGTGSIEPRLETVEEKLNKLRDQFYSTEAKRDSELQRLEKQISDEQNMRRKEVQELLKEIESVSTNGLYWAVIGLLFIGLGLIMSTLSSELFFIIQQF
jgi:hypothetical protein